MAAGDFHIRRNTADASAVPNAGGGNEDAAWDSVVYDEGGIVAYSDPNLQLDIGLYLIMYSESFFTTNTTNNERIEIQGEIHVGGTGVVGGYGQDYIRKSSGHQQCVVSGYMILDVTSDNTDVFTRFYRTDNSTTGTVNREIDHGGIVVLELDSTDNYGFYSDSNTHTVNSTESSLGIDTNDRQDTGFSRSGTGVTVTNAGRYLVLFSMDISQTGTGREEFKAHLEIGTTPIPGSYGYCMLRGADGCQDGAITWIGIVDLAASDVITVRCVSPAGAGTATVATGTGVLQMWEIPSGSDEAIMEATNGDYNAAGDFAWDTLPHIDTGSFTATAGNSNIDVDQRDHVLSFATFSQDAPDTVQRGSPYMKFKSDEVLALHASGNTYHRNSGGIGTVALTVASIMPAVGANASIEVNGTPRAASGAMNLDNGQFTLLSMEALFGPYTFPPIVTDFDTDEQFDWGDTNLVITGADFEAVKGTGKVEFWDDIVGTTKTVQSTDSWADGSIQIDTTQGSLPNDAIIYLVVTTDSGLENPPFPVTVGVPAYHIVKLELNPDHYWRFNNTLADTGITGPARNYAVEVGTWTYTTSNIADGNTHAIIADNSAERIGPADSPNMNITIDAQNRTLDWWIQVGNIQHPLGCIWKEGAQIQNIALLIGYGNVILGQMADTPGNPGNIQAWSDFKLAIDRPYHIAIRYDFPNNFSLFIDGIEQTETDGNPLGAGTFNAHSGDIAIGLPDTTLETGGTDITYDGISDMLISDHASWSENSTHSDNGKVSDTNIRDVLYRRGAVPDDIVVSGTESAMQTALDATADTRPDWPLSFRIQPLTGGGDLELTMNDKVFDALITSHLEWRGGDVLTIVNATTSNIDAAKCWSLTGGTIVVVKEVEIKITFKDIDSGLAVQAARVLVKADTGGDLPFEDTVTITRSGSVATVTHTAHGMISGQKVLIEDAVQAPYNGIKTITVTGVNTYTYTVSGSPTTPATGTIKATTVLLDGTTDASGIITTLLRYTSDQPLTGYARQGSTGAKYQEQPIAATVLDIGTDATVLMISDE